MSRMFKTITRTWNPFTGCGFECRYCWARKLALGKCHYPDFKPAFHPERLKVKFKPDDFVFVTSMGDVSYASWPELRQILEVIKINPQSRFLIQTKEPNMFLDGQIWGENIYQGCTIETNRSIPISKAPPPVERYHAVATNNHPHKFLSIEPIMDFDAEIFFAWILDMKPEIIEIGADNYHNNLPEPEPRKLLDFMNGLVKVGFNVKQKDGLGRLL